MLAGTESDLLVHQCLRRTGWATSDLPCCAHLDGTRQMAEGTIKRLTDKGFGFIDTGGDKDIFFHSSSLDGVTYDELREGQRVSFEEGRGPKGHRAENVKPI